MKFTSLRKKTILLCGLAATAFLAIAHGDPAIRSVPLVSDLRQQTGVDGAVCIVSGYAQAGDGGGGTFVWKKSAEEGDDGGTLIATSGGAWKRLDSGPLRVSWFGAFPVEEMAGVTPEIAEACTDGLERALKAAAGQTLVLGKGIYPVSRTLIIPPGTRIAGQGAFDQWSELAMGSTLATYGPGQRRKWSDSGAEDEIAPLLVAGGNNVVLEHLGLTTTRSQDDRWDVGVLFPATKRCAMEFVNVRGWWKLAAVLLDASWSTENTALTSLHPGIHPSGAIEFFMNRCFIKGRWGLMVRGNVLKDPKTTPSEEWVYAMGGTSDIDVMATRLGTEGPRKELEENGGACYHNVPAKNAAGAGQEHRFFGCSFRVSAKYAIYLDYSNRDKFFGCYAETTHTDRTKAMMANTANTGGVLFAGSRWNVKMDPSCWDFSRTIVIGDVNYNIRGNVRAKSEPPAVEQE